MEEADDYVACVVVDVVVDDGDDDDDDLDAQADAELKQPLLPVGAPRYLNQRSRRPSHSRV